MHTGSQPPTTRYFSGKRLVLPGQRVILRENVLSRRDNALFFGETSCPSGTTRYFPGKRLVPPEQPKHKTQTATRFFGPATWRHALIIPTFVSGLELDRAGLRIQCRGSRWESMESFRPKPFHPFFN